MMSGASSARGQKIPFSSPLMNWCTYGGIPRNKVTEFHGAPGGGKAQPLYSKVLTPSGFIQMKDVSVGQTVLDGEGNKCTVTGVYPQGKRPVFEITTQGNNKFRVADNHLNTVWWYNTEKHCREDFVWDTLTLIQNFERYKKWRKIRIDIPVIDFDYQPVPLDPYLVGALIGDGSLSNNFVFSNLEDDILTKVNSLLHSVDYELVDYTEDKFNWSMRVCKDAYQPGKQTKFRKIIKDLSLDCKSVDKSIPEIYLLNDIDIRLQVLQGLMDTDGHIQKDGVVEFSTSSSKLSQDFSFLVQSLGIRDTVVVSTGKYKNDKGRYVECHLSYQHLLKIPNGLPFFSSKKHSRRYKARQNPPLRNIIDIQYVGEEDCKCIMVDSPLHTYITDNFIPTHNTTTAVDICKNAIQLFKNEFEESVADLRLKVSSGKKEYAGMLEDLIDQGPKKVFYLDLEHAFDEAWSNKLGIENSEIEIMQPPDTAAEDILQTLQELVETGEIGLVVLDSIPSLVTKAELDKKYGERTVSSLAGLLTIFFRKIVPLLTRYECTLLAINQIRDNMDNPYVVNTPGGQALKFYSSLRMLFRLGTPVDFLGNELPASTENPAGYIINAKIIKQKSAPFDRKLGSYYLMTQSGLRPDFDYAQLAVKKYGIIRKSGAWFTVCDPYTGEVLDNEAGQPLKLNGMARVYEYLQANADYYQKIQKYILDDINGQETTEADCDVAEEV